MKKQINITLDLWGEENELGLKDGETYALYELHDLYIELLYRSVIEDHWHNRNTNMWKVPDKEMVNELSQEATQDFVENIRERLEDHYEFFSEYHEEQLRRL